MIGERLLEKVNGLPWTVHLFMKFHSSISGQDILEVPNKYASSYYTLLFNPLETRLGDLIF